MKLKIYWIQEDQLQRSLDLFQDRVKHLTYYGKSDPALFCVVVDEEPAARKLGDKNEEEKKRLEPPFGEHVENPMVDPKPEPKLKD